MIDFAGISLPFSANDLLIAGVRLLAIVGGLILLQMSFNIFAKLSNLINNALYYSGRVKNEYGERHVSPWKEKVMQFNNETYHKVFNRKEYKRWQEYEKSGKKWYDHL
ncbi:hypothetical protein RhiirA1_483999 [Rhizophagus irregularis]|uniref:Uncharacterized protein n=1 Tax=Rhizophagus irregularis TaxID=588596 RepID=A0A2N0QJU4_9GLOM|nr:hypothetical protein RhiirA1_483999 [Rhizophagus irregularis]